MYFQWQYFRPFHNNRSYVLTCALQWTGNSPHVAMWMMKDEESAEVVDVFLFPNQPVTLTNFL